LPPFAVVGIASGLLRDQACQEAGARRALRLVVYLPASEAASAATHTLPDAMDNYFTYRERELRFDLIRLLRYGAVSLGIGVAFLMMCLGLRRTLVLHTLVFARAIVDEGLLILGWVAMWRPTEILLYGWWPLARRRAPLHRLSVIPVEVRVAA
jgi:hypothetical protein